jgi:hypothetical protein
MHMDATARVCTNSSRSYSFPSEGSTNSFTLLESSRGFAFTDDKQFVSSNGLEACNIYDVNNKTD